MQSAAGQAASLFLLMRSKIRQLLTVTALCALLLLLTLLGIYKCPLDFIFGIPCPTCGITRAFVSLLHGDFAGAFYYHPLWPVFILSAVLYLLYFFDIIHPSRRLITTGCCILSAILIGCFILRHIEGSPVVQTHFETSLLHRIISLIS